MRGADQAAGLLLLVGGAAYSATAALRYTYWGASGPGSGFLPVWLGAAMAALALVLLASATRGPAGADWLPRAAGRARLARVVGATAVLIALLPVAGMSLGTVLFLAVLLRLERVPWLTTAGVAVGVAVLDWAVFVWWLRVPLPTGLLGF